MITDAASRRPGGDPTRPFAEPARRREQRRLETSPVYPVAAAKHCIDNIEEAEFVQAAKENAEAKFTQPYSETFSLPSKVLPFHPQQIQVYRLQRWAIRWALGCVNLRPAPRPEGAGAREQSEISVG